MLVDVPFEAYADAWGERVWRRGSSWLMQAAGPHMPPVLYCHPVPQRLGSSLVRLFIIAWYHAHAVSAVMDLTSLSELSHVVITQLDPKTVPSLAALLQKVCASRMNMVFQKQRLLLGHDRHEM